MTTAAPPMVVTEKPHRNPWGRPLKFPSVEDLENKINQYFQSSKESGDPITITGLACALDTSRKVLVEYEERDEYSNAIKRAKQFIEAYFEKMLITKTNVAGVIFSLKNNYKRVDKHEIEANVTHSVSLVNLADLAERALTNQLEALEEQDAGDIEDEEWE